MRLPKDILSGIYKKPQLFLCETDKERICRLETTNTQGTFKFNSYGELSFETARVYTDIVSGRTMVNHFYDKIEALRLIEVEGFGFFELQGPRISGDGIKESKSCTAYSTEYTLSQKYIEDFHVNTGEIDSIEVIYAGENNVVPVTLYNPSNKNLSLLHLILEKIYGWKIGHVDESLQTLSRQFEVDRESVYDFLMNEVCNKFNCYVVFDTIDNTINLYAESLTAKFIGDGKTNMFVITPPFAQIGTVSVNGYKTTRWEYEISTGTLMLEDTPEDGAHIEIVDGALTDWETDVFVSFDNLSQEIDVSYDADAIKTVLTVTYGEDSDIREANLGLPYLTDISYYYTVDWMGQELYDAYTSYIKKSNSSQLEYTNNSQEILKLNDKIYYEKNRLSLEYSLVQSVSPTTVGTYYIRQENLDGSFYYKEVSLPGEYNANEQYYSNVTANVTEEKVASLYEVLKKYFNNENEDNNSGETKITSWKTDLDKLAADFEFMEEYTLDYLSSELSKVNENRTENKAAEIAINNFLSEIWAELGKTPLEELYLKPYQTIQETNIKAGWSQKDSDNYGYYYPVLLYIGSIEAAITERNATIKTYEDQRSVFDKNNSDIADSLAMDKNFTEKQLIKLSAFLREDELHIEDIVETNQDDLSSSFKIKQDAMESGRIELQKLCQPQLQFSMSMANIYALPEFEPIVWQFQLGNVIKVALRPDYIKQSRLLQVNINFDDFSDFSCEFGELTSLRSQSDIHADLLKNAITAGKSVATNSSYWSRGSDAATSIDLKIQQGLLDATTQIKAIDGSQGTVIDKNGIHLRSVNPITGEVDPKQGWIVNNQFLYSDDGFKSTKSVFGEYTYDGNSYYGILAESIVGRFLIGSQIKLENSSGTMSFDANGFNVYNSTNAFNVSPDSSRLVSISKTSDNEDIFYVDDDGNLNITGIITAKTGGSIAGWNIDDHRIYKKVKLTDIGKNYTVSLFSHENYWHNNDSVSSDRRAADVLTVEVKAQDGESEYPFQLLKDGTLNCSNINAAGGTIGGWDIEDCGIQKTVNNRTTGIHHPGSGAWSFAAGAINSEDWSTAPFRVDHNGNMYSTSGSVGGWLIGTMSLSSTKSGQINGVNYTSNVSLFSPTNFLHSSGTKAADVFYVKVTNNDTGVTSFPFTVLLDGTFTAQKANITGTITANDGSIGGWNIESYKLWNFDNTNTYGTGMAAGTNYGNPAFWAGYTGNGNTPFDYTSTDGSAWYDKTSFYVTNDGRLVAKSAILSGNVTASSGDIGGLTIKNSKLYRVTQWIGTNASGTSQRTAYTSGVSPTFANATGHKIFLWAGFSRVWNTTGEASWADDIFGSEDWNAAYNWITSENGAKFYVTHEGILYARDAHISGSINATDGDIGGWTIGTSSLTSGTIGADNSVHLYTNFTGGNTSIGGVSSSNWRLTIGGNFGVTKEGYMYASGGKVGSWSIVGDGLSSLESYTVGDYDYIAQLKGTTLHLVRRLNGVTQNYLYSYWYDIYYVGKERENSRSDIRLKNSIEDLSDEYDILFDSLKPQRYKYNHGTSDRYHTGFIAQDVVDAVESSGLTTKDFAAAYIDGENEENSYWYLRRDEFVALNTWQIQKAKARIAELEEKTTSLESKLTELEEKINKLING